MSCELTHQALHHPDALSEAERAALHLHLAHCATCRARYDARVDAALADLATLRSQRPAVEVIAALQQRQRQRTREFVLAVVASVLCVLAAIGLQASDANFARWALPIMAFVFAVQAWRSLRDGRRFLRASAADGPLQWARELQRERRLIRYGGPLVALQFAALTGWLIHWHGWSDPRLLIYLLTAVLIVGYVAWQIGQRLPRIERELRLLADLQSP